MSTNILSRFGNSSERVEKAIAALRRGEGVLVADDEERENEGDLIYPAESVTVEQMALMIRECSGIVCLCLTEDRVRRLQLPMMVENASNGYHAAYTVSIDGAHGVSSGVSAADRVATIRAAVADDAVPEDLRRPGHIFPLKARCGGVLERRGHTEATVDLMHLAGLKPAGILCELTNPDGSMARLPELAAFAERHNIALISIDDLVQYRLQCENHINADSGAGSFQA